MASFNRKSRVRAQWTCLLAAGLAAAGAAVIAQPAPPARTPYVAQPPASIDAEHMALARQYVRQARVDQGIRTMFAGMMRSAPQIVGVSESEARSRNLLASLSAAMEGELPEFMDATAEAAAHVFTTQELKDIVAFYASPSGQAMVAKTPALMQQVGPLAYRIVPKVYLAAEDDFCRRETCTDADRAGFDHLEAAFVARGRPPPAR